MNAPPLSDEARRAFEAGRRALEEERAVEAQGSLERAFRLATGHPEVMSWYGAALALAGTDVLRGVTLCEAALRRAGGRGTADLYWNLGRACLVARYRAQALQALRDGAQLEPEHPGIHACLVRLGLRRSPLIPFLRRGNVVNKYLGKLRHRLFGDVSW